MAKIDFETLDRDLRRARSVELRAHRRLREELPSDDASYSEGWTGSVRYVATRSTFHELLDLDGGEPLREAMIRWVYRFCLARIGAPLRRAVALERSARRIEAHTPVPGIFSAREIILRVLHDASVVRGAEWLDRLAEGAGPIAEAERRRAEGEVEIAARLGASDGELAGFSVPLGLPAASSVLTDLASKCLSSTRELFAHAVPDANSDSGSGGASGRPALSARIRTLLARDVRGGWPAHLNRRWLEELFAAGPLFAGLRLDVGPLSARRGVSSFQRALARLGAAYARAVPNPSFPFCLAHDPSETFAYRRGALFASLLLDEKFLRLAMRMSRDETRECRSALLATTLGQLRLDAARTWLTAQRPPHRSPSDAREFLSDALGIPLPGALVGVLPRPDTRAPARLVGALLAAGDAIALRDQFDDDWFRNPRALTALREQDGSARSPEVVSATALAASAATLLRGLEQLA